MIPIVPIKTSIFLLSCVNQLLLSNSTKTLKVFVLNYKDMVGVPVFRYDWRKGELPFTIENPDIYIIKTELEILNTTFDYLERRFIFNPKARFIFIVDTLQKELFMDYFIEKFIQEMIVIENKPKTSFLLDKYKTVREGKSNSTLLKNSEHCYCQGGDIQCNKTISYPIKYSSMRVGLSYNAPSVILENNVTDGIDVAVLRTIATKMELSIDFDIVDEFTGMRNMENFSFNGALGSLEKKEVDLVVGGILRKSDSVLFFEFTRSTTINRYAWIVPAAKTRPFWKRIILTYTLLVWILFFSTFLTVLIILTSINGIMKDALRVDTEFLKLYSMCLTSVEVKPTELLSKRILFVSWYLFLLVFSNYFTAKLLSNLVVKKYEYQIQHPDEFLDVNWNVCMFTDLTEFITSLGNRKVITCSNCEFCTNRTAFKGDLISVRSESLMAYEMHKFYINKNGEPLLFLLDRFFLITYDVIAFRKNHPNFSRINELLSILKDNGIYQKIASKYTPKNKAHQKIVWKPLAYKQLSFIFKFVMYGLFLSIFIFIFEVNIKSKNI